MNITEIIFGNHHPAPNLLIKAILAARGIKSLEAREYLNWDKKEFDRVMKGGILTEKQSNDLCVAFGGSADFWHGLQRQQFYSKKKTKTYFRMLENKDAILKELKQKKPLAHIARSNEVSAIVLKRFIEDDLNQARVGRKPSLTKKHRKPILAQVLKKTRLQDIAEEYNVSNAVLRKFLQKQFPQLFKKKQERYRLITTPDIEFVLKLIKIGNRQIDVSELLNMPRDVVKLYFEVKDLL